jgi:hypothetical protein
MFNWPKAPPEVLPNPPAGVGGVTFGIEGSVCATSYFMLNLSAATSKIPSAVNAVGDDWLSLIV